DSEFMSSDDEIFDEAFDNDFIENILNDSDSDGENNGGSSNETLKLEVWFFSPGRLHLTTSS
ncbi:hypothetical protein RhiirA1_430231, partial [Rhizophagus irregularis]